MRPEEVAAADRELKRAARARRRMVLAADLDEAEAAWTDFLRHANRVYLKLRAACFGHPLDWSWWKRKMDERRDDPLLSYMHHARNSDTHRIEDTVKRVPAGPFIPALPAVGEINHSGPQHLLTLPVTDKGVTYQAPIEHPGFPVVYPDAAHVAHLASAHLHALVAEAAYRLR